MIVIQITPAHLARFTGHRTAVIALLALLLLPLVGSGQANSDGATLKTTQQESQRQAADASLEAPPALSAEGMAALTPQQLAAMEAYRSMEMENLVNQLFKLEGRISAVVQEQVSTRQSVDRVRQLDSLRQAAELTTQRARYLQSLNGVAAVLTGVEELRTLYDWKDFLGEARALGDPTTYETFSTGLAALREEQKNSLRLPSIALLDNPHMSSFYVLSSALGTKDEPEERAKLERLATILDFAMQADRQVNYIATEVAFAQQMGHSLQQRAAAVRDKLFALVNLEPGKLDDARRKFFNFQFSAEFTDKQRDTIAAYEREADLLQDEYNSYLFALATALEKAAFGLDGVEPHGTDNALVEMLNARKAELYDRIREAAAAVARHRGGNG